MLNAVTVVQSYTQERAEAERFDRASEAAFDTARSRTKVRSLLVARDGRVIDAYSSMTSPDDRGFVQDIERSLKQNP